MTAIDALPRPEGANVPAPARPGWLRSNWGVVLAIAALVTVLLLPTPEGLSVAGQRMLAVLAFAVIVWNLSAGMERLRMERGSHTLECPSTIWQAMMTSGGPRTTVVPGGSGSRLMAAKNARSAARLRSPSASRTRQMVMGSDASRDSSSNTADMRGGVRASHVPAAGAWSGSISSCLNATPRGLTFARSPITRYGC